MGKNRLGLGLRQLIFLMCAPVPRVRIACHLVIAIAEGAVQALIGRLHAEPYSFDTFLTTVGDVGVRVHGS